MSRRCQCLPCHCLPLPGLFFVALLFQAVCVGCLKTIHQESLGEVVSRVTSPSLAGGELPLGW